MNLIPNINYQFIIDAISDDGGPFTLFTLFVSIILSISYIYDIPYLKTN